MVSGRNHSFVLRQLSRECLINIPGIGLAEQVVPPLIAECFAQLECQDADTAMVDKDSLFVLEAIKAWHVPAVNTPQTLHHQGRPLFGGKGTDHA